MGTTGNASTQSLGVGGELTYRPGSWETQFKANYVRNESEDVLKAETYRFSARAGWA